MERRGVRSRVLIAEDHALVREGIRAMLEGEESLEVVGEAQDGEEAIERARRLKPDLVLMDVRMPGTDGIEATRRIKEEFPRTAVLMVTTHESPNYMLDAVRAGAAGYVVKHAGRRQLIGAVRQALSGESALDRELAMKIIRRVAEERAGEVRPKEEKDEANEEAPGTGQVCSKELAKVLTPREADVLALLACGKTNPMIAEELYMGLGTVKIHVRRIIQKLGVSDRTQAAVKAVEMGLVVPDR